jgi:PAS domain S-box-containing protein
MKKNPLLLFTVVFLILMVITQYLVYQQYSLRKEKRKAELNHELIVARDKFKDILNSSLISANAIAIIYKELGLKQNFESIAKPIIDMNKEIDMLGLTDRFIITNVFPLKGNESHIGFDISVDSLRKKEALGALKKNNLHYSGPFLARKKSEGYVVFARAPIFIKDTFAALALVRIKLSVIEKALEFSRLNNKFIYQLSKVNTYTHKAEYFFTKFEPQDYEYAESVEMPEGNWTLYASYNLKKLENIFPFYLATLGFMFSLLAGVLVYFRAKEPEELKKIIDIKTHDLNERVKELSTIYRLSEILQQKNRDSDEIFNEIVNLIPPGWQYPEVCEAKITFNSKAYTTKGYASSDFRLSSDFNLSDGRKGTIEVIYAEERPEKEVGPFLKEEQDLINVISERIEVFLNKIIHQEALAQSEAKFRGAFENSAIGMALVSLKQEYLKVNNALCEMLGYTQQEFPKITPLDITHAGDIVKDEEFIKETLAGKADFYNVEKRYIHKNGGIVWVNLNSAVVKDNDGTPQYFVSQIENITEKKRTAQQLVESEKRVRETLNLLPQSVFEVDTTGKITFANQAGFELFGFTKLEFEKGILVAELIVKDELERAATWTQAFLKGDIKSGGREYKNIKRDGTVFPLMVYSSAIKNGNEVIGIRSIGIDMTEFRKNEAAINKLMQLNFKKEKELEKTRAMSLIEGQEQERLRISREIHDGIGQVMTGIKMSSESINLTSISSPIDLEKLECTKALISDVIVELRQISNDLSPTFLYDYGLFLSVKQLVLNVSKISNIQADLNSNIRDIRFLSVVEIMIYRIMQEAINNTLKYSQAKNLKINLIQDAEFLDLLIEDDGVGVDLMTKKQDNSESGNGLKNMSTRANLIGANFSIITSQGNGFQIGLQIPLENAALK